MKFFNNKASKGSSGSRLNAGKLQKGINRLVGAPGRESRSCRDSMFETLENRQMFSVSAAAITAINAEYTTASRETDAYGHKVGSLIGSATSGIVAVTGVTNAAMQTFGDNGAIYWSASTGAHVVYGAIGAAYHALGAAGSWLGLPTHDETGPANARVSSFQDGSISWSPSGGAVEHQTAVTVATRYSNELVVTENGPRDQVSVSQSGSTLTISADGQTFTDAVPAGGLFEYARGGADKIQVASSVKANTTIVTIGSLPCAISSSGSNVSIWADPTDTVTGGTSVHIVRSFAGGVSKAVGASLANPSDSGATFTVQAPLFATGGPVPADINQGEIGDCYFVASLAAFAHEDPKVITNSVVDMGDGTYAVEFYKNGTPEFVRVNNSMPIGPWNGYDYAHPGSDGAIWVAVMEKAFCYFRSGANTYDSIGGGWMSEVYTDLNVTSVSTTPDTFSQSTLFSRLQNDLSLGEAVTMGTPDYAPDLVGDHAYTLMAVEKVGGKDEFIVRNPWGDSGTVIENSQGIATLTYAEFINNFDEMVEST